MKSQRFVEITFIVTLLVQLSCSTMQEAVNNAVAAAAGEQVENSMEAESTEREPGSNPLEKAIMMKMQPQIMQAYAMGIFTLVFYSGGF